MITDRAPVWKGRSPPCRAQRIIPTDRTVYPSVRSSLHSVLSRRDTFTRRGGRTKLASIRPLPDNFFRVRAHPRSEVLMEILVVIAILSLAGLLGLTL